MTKLHEKFEAFMRESNWIEGERESICSSSSCKLGQGVLHVNDIKAMGVMEALASDGVAPNEVSLCMIHSLLAEGRDDLEEKGTYRTCEVVIGGRQGKPAKGLAIHMSNFFDQWNKRNAWELHALYEQIHPFEDLNGRTGRILWAWRMIQEGRDPFWMPFLQAYYYQTLSNHVVT